MTYLKDQRDREKARRDARLWAAAAGGRSGLVSPMAGGTRQGGGRGAGSTIAVPSESSLGPNQGTPATITGYASDLEVPAAGAVVTFDGALADPARKNLLALNDVSDGVPLTWVGTYRIDVDLEWTLTTGFRGGGSVELLLDNIVVWPVEVESTTDAPTTAYDLPRFRATVTVYNDTAGATLKVKPSQTSGSSQTCDLKFGVTLVEPRGAAITDTTGELLESLTLDSEVHSFDGGEALVSGIVLDSGSHYTIAVVGWYYNDDPVSKRDSEISDLDGNMGGPVHNGSLTTLMSLDGTDASAEHIEPPGGAPTTADVDNLYIYQVTGQGNALRIATNDSPLTDNSGTQEVSIFSGWIDLETARQALV